MRPPRGPVMETSVTPVLSHWITGVSYPEGHRYCIPNGTTTRTLRSPPGGRPPASDRRDEARWGRGAGDNGESTYPSADRAALVPKSAINQH